MIDFFDIPNNSLKTQVFYQKGNTDWQTWNKPKGAKMIYILCIGGGAGGGGGANGTVSTTRRGGGGGGSAGYTVGFYSASQLPDQLYVQPGPGGSAGAGGSTSATGGTGSISYVSVEPNTTAINVLLQSGNAAPSPGGAPGPGGAGGTAGTAWTGAVLDSLGLVVAYAGQTGSGGATNFTPTSISINKITTAGAGGAGTNLSAVFDGGSITGGGFIPEIPGGSGSASGQAGHGSGGFSQINEVLKSTVRVPLTFTGGAGGGSSNSATGGVGGNGGYGCGGGGGGVGVTSAGGTGGAGGDGLVIIVSL